MGLPTQLYVKFQNKSCAKLGSIPGGRSRHPRYLFKLQPPAHLARNRQRIYLMSYAYLSPCLGGQFWTYLCLPPEFPYC